MLEIKNHVLISILFVEQGTVFIQLLALEQVRRRAVLGLLLAVAHLYDAGHLVADAGPDAPFRDVLTGAQPEERGALVSELSVVGRRDQAGDRLREVGDVLEDLEWHEQRLTTMLVVGSGSKVQQTVVVSEQVLGSCRWPVNMIQSSLPR
jgi:hypothetical protein